MKPALQPTCPPTKPLVEFHWGKSISPLRLDKFLAAGWFRSGQTMFKCNVLPLMNNLWGVKNIRLDIPSYEPSKSLAKIFRKNEQHFTTYIRPMMLDADKQQLYEQHKHKFQGYVYTNIIDFFMNDGTRNVFNTWEIAVYEGNTLVAASFFDKGKKSAASILCITSQQHEKYSLGHYTMLCEVFYLQKEGFKWYYPGYVFDAPSSFDYKLRLGNYLYQNEKARWIKITTSKPFPNPASVIKEKIGNAEKILTILKIPVQRKLYPIFSIAYLHFFTDFVKSPLLLLLPLDTGKWYALEYVYEDNIFCFSEIKYAYINNLLHNVTITPDFEGENYCSTPLRHLQMLTQNTNIDVVIRYIVNFWNRINADKT